MSPYEYIKRIFKGKAAKKGSDFSTFVPAAPLSRNHLLIEECKKQDVSICIDDPTEQSLIFRSVASEAELERRLNAKKATDLSRRANVIALFALIMAAIALVKSFL